MALIFPSVPIVFTVSSFEYWMQTHREQGWRESHHFQLYPAKGESWTVLKKSTVESTTLAQPFCVNQSVGLGLHAQFVVLRQFSHWLALPSFKTTLIVKSQTVIECLQLSDTEIRDDKKWRDWLIDWLISEKLHFHLLGEHAYSKLDRVKTMGTGGKIKAIWWNIKINLQKNGIYMWIWTANKFAKFHAKKT